MQHKYDPKKIEGKWQEYWEQNQSFRTSDDYSLPKYYVLDMFPYPSGSGLHVGHPEGYTATDIIARYKRMNGFNVLHPMGWDAFGLPAERAAVREGRHPAEITKENISNFTSQIKRLGLSYDWNRAVNTSSPDYYKWTQWIFQKLFEKNLAYLAEVPVNWCPAQGTVLANEEVQDGKYIETGDPVERKMMRQWMLRITSYAQRLIDDLDGLDWPPGIIEMQKKWIGRSEGARINFKVQSSEENLDVFTTRPDTIFGATFLVLAPENPLIDKITSSLQKEAVISYVQSVANVSDLDRETASAKDKTGVFTGAYVTNPVNGKSLPVWIADYVKMDYGTGAIMAVPAHDERDSDFATKYDLPRIEVITDDNRLINSDFLDGESVIDAKNAIRVWLEENSVGQAETTYKLRDWLFSRQRYWGEPFPVLYGKDGNPVMAPESSLPITLPELAEFKPTHDGRPPLARAEEWKNVEIGGDEFERETNTMPQWAGSCWYYLRFMDPANKDKPFDQEAEKYWGPVDLYVGGVEHAVLHLLYARFWHKVLYDCGLVHTKEPFNKLFNQGMILGISYKDEHGKYYHPKDVEARENAFFAKGSDTLLATREEKMSKSKLNVVNPDDVIAAYGADALRLYEMFMGPLEAVKPWQMNGVKGVYGFLERAWSMIVDTQTGELNSAIKSAPESQASDVLLRELNVTIDKVKHDIDGLRFNTAVAKMMEFVNVAKKEKQIPAEVAGKFVKLLAPFAPHMAEELWHRLGNKDGITYQPWPEADAKWLVEESMNISIHFNGKRKAGLNLDSTLDETQIREIVEAMPEMKRHFENVSIQKIIYVPNKLMNFIVK